MRITTAAKYNERFQNIRGSMQERMRAIDRLRARDLGAVPKGGD